MTDAMGKEKAKSWSANRLGDGNFTDREFVSVILEEAYEAGYRDRTKDLLDTACGSGKEVPKRVREVHSMNGLRTDFFEVGSPSFVNAEQNPDKFDLGREYVSMLELLVIGKTLTEKCDEEWVKELSPYILSLSEQVTCECGYFGETDESGEALSSICAICSLKDLIGTDFTPISKEDLK